MLHKLKRRKYAHQALLSLYGINKCTANKIIGVLRWHPQTADYNLLITRNRDTVRRLLVSLRIDFRLRIIVFSRICLQIFLGTYRGLRHLQGLPCRGQRTHANGRTPKRLKLQGKNFPFNFKKRFFARKLSKKELKRQARKASVKQKKLQVKQKKKKPNKKKKTK